jgi:hypothetical protein
MEAVNILYMYLFATNLVAIRREALYKEYITENSKTRNKFKILNFECCVLNIYIYILKYKMKTKLFCYKFNCVTSLRCRYCVPCRHLVMKGI